ncbi:Protein of unknown function [Pyronema omphalodes CBS 100304]|uniref:Uncharacterized protein n=1 Tax=Pyronema omphalodes (strain CBS 100304) TaxID=1076935 RepID=U4LAT9_PYROM|nr:Protein of unknown function [Pyronema omphalodes CBS 100304]
MLANISTRVSSPCVDRQRRRLGAARRRAATPSPPPTTAPKSPTPPIHVSDPSHPDPPTTPTRILSPCPDLPTTPTRVRPNHPHHPGIPICVCASCTDSSYAHRTRSGRIFRQRAVPRHHITMVHLTRPQHLIRTEDSITLTPMKIRHRAFKMGKLPSWSFEKSESRKSTNAEPLPVTPVKREIDSDPLPPPYPPTVTAAFQHGIDSVPIKLEPEEF